MRNAVLATAALSALCCLGSAAASNDPMRPMPRPGSVQTEPASRPARASRPTWVLSSTLVGEARKVAVINDRLVGIGDRVLGAEVIGIGARSARLRYAGQEFHLQLGADRFEKRFKGQMRDGAQQ